MRKRSWRALIGLLAAVVVGAALPSLASASNHEIKIREVYPGDTSHTEAEYVELQMYAPGQNLFNLGTSLNLYGPTGNITKTYDTDNMTSNPPNSASQQRVIYMTTAAESLFSKTAGFVFSSGDALSPAGGAVCYLPTAGGSFDDCVSWGTFSGTLPSTTGGNVDSGGIPNGMALGRSIAHGCSTMLEAADDTNKPADWSDVAPNPLRNADPFPEIPCPNATITKKPKSKTTDKTPTFKFKAGGSSVTFKCRVDKEAFADCSSPFTTHKLSKGKHTFQVRATNSGGGTGNPAKATFTVIRKKPHHHH